MAEPLTIRQFVDAQNQAGLGAFDRRGVLASLILTVVAFAIVLLEPFGLGDIAALPRILYWGFVCLIGYGLFGATFLLGGRALERLGLRLSYPVGMIAMGFIASVFMTVAVVFAGNLFFRLPGLFGEQFLTAFPRTLTIGAALLAVSVVSDYLGEQHRRLQAGRDLDKEHNRAIASLMEHLPVRLRGELLCLRAEDHYLRVYTDKGDHLFLMRLRDALTLLENARGLQVHRSWWVAENAVHDVQRDGRRIQLVLNNGVRVPVSRKFAPAARSHNLLK